MNSVKITKQGLDFGQWIEFQELVIRANVAQQSFMLEHIKHVLNQRREDELVRETWHNQTRMEE